MVRAWHAAFWIAMFPVLALDGWAVAAEPAPALLVEAAYPGASAADVEDTVAAPIEQQVNGVEKLLHLKSRCRADGSYALEITFAPGTDLNVAQGLVQNRVSLAMPILPEAVKRLGVVVRKQSPGLLMTVCLFSSDGRYDTRFLSNYASIQIKDELTRVPGVSDVVILGRQADALRIWVDPDRMAARNLTNVDFLRALEAQNLKAATDAPFAAGRETPFTTNLGRPTAPQQIEEMIIKATDQGVIRLRDVARLELGAGRSGYATLDGKPIAALAIYPAAQSRQQDVSAAVRAKLAELRNRFPPGLEADSEFDFTKSAEGKTPAALVLDLNLPAGAPMERIERVLRHASQELQKTPGVRHVLALSEQPFDRDRDQACLVASLDAAHSAPAEYQRVASAARTSLAQAANDGLIRLREPIDNFTRFGYSLDFAIYGPQRDHVQELTDRLVTRLSEDRRLTDVWAGPGPAPFLSIDVDRDKAMALGVSLNDISATLETALGSVAVGNLNVFGRVWQVQVHAENRGRIDFETLKRLQLRSDKGQMVPLGAIAVVRDLSGRPLHERFDMSPAVSITANPAQGLSLAEARSICERLAAAELTQERPAGYQLAWLREMPAPRAPAQREPAVPQTPAALPQVSVAQPIERVVAEYDEIAGRLEAVQSVELRARVTGLLARVLFKAGTVKQGDLLYEIDPRPFQAALDRAGADYRLREAQLKLASSAVERDRALVSRGAIAKEDLDRDEAARIEAEAALNVAKADHEVAKVNLESTRVNAPIDGQIGPPVTAAGNVVKAFETPLGILVSVEPIYASFNVDERTLLRLRRQQLSDGKTLADGAARVPVFMGLADEEGFPHQGQFDSSDPRLDADTGTLRCRAVFPNPKGLLMPGMFARLRLPTSAPAPALLVPEQAVGADRGQRIVHVVTEANAIERRMVVPGSLIDGLRVIRSGLSAGDWVVVDPPRGLAPGARVEPQKKAISIPK